MLINANLNQSKEMEQQYTDVGQTNSNEEENQNE
jgi:hypothetical protein